MLREVFRPPGPTDIFPVMVLYLSQQKGRCPEFDSFRGIQVNCPGVIRGQQGCGDGVFQTFEGSLVLDCFDRYGTGVEIHEGSGLIILSVFDILFLSRNFCVLCAPAPGDGLCQGFHNR